MSLLRNRKIVPALMFHSVGLESHPWVWSHLSEPLRTFEGKIAMLRCKRFNSVTWSELYDYMGERRELPGNSILLSFDDGYLDNWVYVYPLLKRYGLRGTVFINPEFVDPAPIARPNAEDVEAGRASPDSIDARGFLSWAEMREMERSGVIDIQSHALTHTWWFSSSRIVGFNQGDLCKRAPWLAWNAVPERKPFYLREDQSGFVPVGYPVFEHEKALVVRRFFPDESAIDQLLGFVAENGGDDLFRDVREGERRCRDWIDKRFGGSDFPGRYESDTEREERIFGELSEAKNRIETELDKTVDFICWPGGGADALTWRLAREAGYRAWTLGSSVETAKRNLPGQDPTSIKRMGTDNRVRLRGQGCARGGALHQWLQIAAHQGSLFHRGLLLVYKAFAVMAPGWPKC